MRQEDTFPMNRQTISMLVLAAAMVGEASAQQYVYPAKGQTPQQQQNDESEIGRAHV